MYRCTGVQTYRRTGVQAYRRIGGQVYRRTDIQAYRRTGVHAYRRTGVQVYRCGCVHVYTVQLYNARRRGHPPALYFDHKLMFPPTPGVLLGAPLLKRDEVSDSYSYSDSSWTLE